jgi:hypothetical protein
VIELRRQGLFTLMRDQNGELPDLPVPAEFKQMFRDWAEGRVDFTVGLMQGGSITIAIVVSMAMTSMQIDSTVRDELAAVAENDFHGAPLGEAVRRLVKEHKINRIMQRYEELRADPKEWASYQAEARLTDDAAGDGLPGAREEYPEYNQ